MRHYKFTVWVMALLIVLSFVYVPSIQVDAETNTDDACCTYFIKSGIRFIWVRSQPSSTASIVITLYPGTQVIKSLPWDGTTLSWDGSQNWVKVAARYGRITGWVEAASLVYAPFNRTLGRRKTAEWGVGDTVRLRASIPFAWMRTYPSSYSAVMATSYSGYNFTIMGNPARDSRQWWWPVRSIDTGDIGWAEQNSLELLR